jgi:CubicO group peptidase (beta-lactamase class C family)
MSLSARFGAAAFAAALFMGVSSVAAEAAPHKAAPGGGWEVCAPEEVGMSSEAFAGMLERIKAEDLEIHSVIIVRNDRLVLEAYVHPYNRGTLHNVKSVSKSVISALVGIALREGVIGNLDETVYSHLPQYISDDMDPRKKDIKLRHLLTMTAGLDLDENGPISNQVFGRLDWLKAAYERPMRDDPGTRFLYSTPLTHTMSAILTESSGMSLHEFADEHLFGPLDFGEVQWTKGPQGYNLGGAELFLRPIDMAKFGYLFLKAGMWKGRQVVPADWVEESTTNKLHGVADGLLYGYWWWLDEDGWCHARGWGGQAIFIHEGLDLVVVFTAADAQAPRQLLGEYIVPALETRQEREADHDGVERLARLAYELEHPEPQEVPDMPATAAGISGRKFEMGWNTGGVESMILDFKHDGTAVLSLDTTLGEYDLAVGLDRVYRLSDTGTWGGMPSGNRRASRGWWADEHTFHLSMRELGNPVYYEQDFTFAGDEVQVYVSVEPVGRELGMSGKAEPE